jgi:hypothetical protein
LEPSAWKLPVVAGSLMVIGSIYSIGYSAVLQDIRQAIVLAKEA